MRLEILKKFKASSISKNLRFQWASFYIRFESILYNIDLILGIWSIYNNNYHDDFSSSPNYLLGFGSGWWLGSYWHINDHLRRHPSKTECLVGSNLGLSAPLHFYDLRETWSPSPKDISMADYRLPKDKISAIEHHAKAIWQQIGLAATCFRIFGNF